MEIKKNFTINAKTCTLKYNLQEGNETIFGNRKKYVIPIYQRPYSWTDDQIRKFLSDIFSSYWGNDCQIIEEPMFIGTMQLSDKNDKNEQDIIDGQQRLTTFLLLLKVLKHKFKNCNELKEIDFDWLSTRVNSGKQQSYLEEIINSDLTVDYTTLNPYLQNAYLIIEAIEEQLFDEQNSTLNFEIDRFVKYLLSNIYFVVIETKAGLSKTLQIFNAINTTGLDLDGGYVFKIRMYEYLRAKKSKDESTFDEISRLYQKIDDGNSEIKYKATNITGILSIYQYILIAKYNLPVLLNKYATDTFFEQLFDTILKINEWDHFKNNVDKIELSLDDLNKIIDVRYEWENCWYSTAEDACAYYFIENSRYGKYLNIIPIFLFQFKENEDDYHKKMFSFSIQLSKLYIIYSVLFGKAVNEIHTFSYSLIKDIMNKSSDEVMYSINKKIGSINDHNGFGNFEMVLNGEITENPKIKKILCTLSAMLEEDYKTKDNAKIESIKDNLFESAIDIEHIQSYHDSNGDKREDIWNEWGQNINSIGNLMVLEQTINRSISNNPYKTKIKSYPSSIFSIAKNQATVYSDWNLEKCLERKAIETSKIMNYIFK